MTSPRDRLQRMADGEGLFPVYYDPYPGDTIPHTLQDDLKALLSERRVEREALDADELLKCVSYFRDAKTIGEQAGRGEELARKVEITIRKALSLLNGEDHG